MPKEVVWSQRAEFDLEEIISFFNERNQSPGYAKKLISKFEKAGNILASFPFVGLKTDVDNIRFLIIKYYLLFYEVETGRIVIHSIWDSRQDPDQMKKLIEELGE